MSNEVYPALPGLTFGVKRAPFWKTDVRTTPSGREFRSSQQVYPRRKITLAYELLRNYGTFTELQQLEGFFNRHQGALSSFLFDDPDDRAVTAQAFGVGDGTTVAFQLARTFGGYVEPVRWVNGSPSIYKNGVLQSSGYTLSSAGVVTFSTAPASGVVVSWTGSYYWRVRFADDSLDFEKFLTKLWKLGKVELITIKDLA